MAEPPEIADSLESLLARAAALTGCAVSLVCEHPNLETVYVMREKGRVLVTDRGETLGYLATSPAPIYDPALVGFDAARVICRECEVDLDTSDPDGFPPVVRPVGAGDDVAVAVSAVAEAVERLFRAATRPEYRRYPR